MEHRQSSTSRFASLRFDVTMCYTSLHLPHTHRRAACYGSMCENTHHPLHQQADYAYATGLLYTARTSPRCHRGLHLARNAHESALLLFTFAPLFHSACHLLYFLFYSTTRGLRLYLPLRTLQTGTHL